MSCVLRAVGKKFDIDEFLKKSKLKPCAVFRKGEPRLQSEPRGEKNKHSAVNIDVSKAGFDNLRKQIRDAVKFLRNNEKEIKRLVKFPDLDDEPELDFGIERRDVFAQSDYFPAELVTIAGKLGLGIRLSQYPIEHDKDEE